MDHNKLWNILKEMGILDHLTCLLRNLYAGQEATELDMEQQTGSKLGKVYVKAVYFHCLWKSVLSTDFIFLVSKITADGNCNHEMKRYLFPGRKVMTNLERVLKSRDLFADKGLYSQSYGFSSSHVWM